MALSLLLEKAKALFHDKRYQSAHAKATELRSAVSKLQHEATKDQLRRYAF